ncbi:hypothetical protein N9Y92_00210 [Chlamydiales bacterium]|nr:hypothetical protein [Chlamydiales bacterium]
MFHSIIIKSIFCFGVIEDPSITEKTYQLEESIDSRTYNKAYNLTTDDGTVYRLKKTIQPPLTSWTKKIQELSEVEELTRASGSTRERALYEMDSQLFRVIPKTLEVTGIDGDTPFVGVMQLYNPHSAGHAESS